MFSSNWSQVLAESAQRKLTCPPLEYEQPEDGWRSTDRVEESLKTGWGCIEDLYRAFEPRTLERTSEQVEEILRNHERRNSELEHIQVEADRLEDVDRQIVHYQDAMTLLTI